MTHFSDAILGRVFSMLERYAIDGQRCPPNVRYGDEGISPGTLAELARRGDIRVEYAGNNFRRVFILVGPHAGKSTAPNTKDWKPWMILNKDGMARNEKQAPIRGAKPSLAKLRFLEREEE